MKRLPMIVLAAAIALRRGSLKNAFHLRIGQLPSEVDAETLAGQLRGKYGDAEPKVSG